MKDTHFFIALDKHYLVLIILYLIDFIDDELERLNLPKIVSWDSNPVLTQPFAFTHCSTASCAEGSRSNENSLRLRHVSVII